MNARLILFLGCLSLTRLWALSQDTHRHQTDFTPEEFEARRAQIFDAIGEEAFALVQGAASTRGFIVFRQSNQFYYLTGVEVPHAYLLLDGRNESTHLFLPHRDEKRERNEGKTLSAEDADLVKDLTGVDSVLGVGQLSRQLYSLAMRSPAPALYTPWSPAEGRAQSRDEILSGHAGRASDPWDGRASKEGHFIQLLRTRYPQFKIRDLSPILDEMRIVKSPGEIDLIRKASRLAGHGIMEAIRSTEPGAKEFQLGAAARFVFLSNGAQGEAYNSITGSGTNAYYGHYSRNDAELHAGDLVLMDYAPDYRYYVSDVTRMWPVSGEFNQWQKELYGFIIQYSKALIKRIRPGVTVDTILDEAAEEMEQVLDGMTFSKTNHERAARESLRFRGHLSHPVGLAVHDVGRYKGQPLVAGTVFTVDPMLWVHDEKLYIRMEDTVVVTEEGVENFTDFMPTELDEIEALMKEDGILQTRPPILE